MMGANKIGSSPSNSVVGPNQQVWGVESLYIIDASIFPTSVGANPMQTIYTTAKIFVDRHLRVEKGR
jgi:choline dehydrogenase-like flavoprotein